MAESSRPEKVSSSEIERALEGVPDWAIRGGKLHREYRFRKFTQAFGYVTRAAIAVALLLMGQFFTFSHSVDHDSNQSDCVVCRISKSHKEAIVSLVTTDTVVSIRSTEAVLAQAPPSLKPITSEANQKRAPPIYS